MSPSKNVQGQTFTASYSSLPRRRIQERTIAVRFLAIILRVLRLDVYITNQFQTTFSPGGGGSTIRWKRWLWIARRKTHNYIQEFGLCSHVVDLRAKELQRKTIYLSRREPYIFTCCTVYGHSLPCQSVRTNIIIIINYSTAAIIHYTGGRGTS